MPTMGVAHGRPEVRSARNSHENGRPRPTSEPEKRNISFKPEANTEDGQK